MANKTVKIYERAKVQEKWTDRPVSIPKLKADGTMYLRDGREGKFHISWYEGKTRSGIRRPARPSAMLSRSEPTRNGSSGTRIVPECKTHSPGLRHKLPSMLEGLELLSVTRDKPALPVFDTNERAEAIPLDLKNQVWMRKWRVSGNG